MAAFRGLTLTITVVPRATHPTSFTLRPPGELSLAKVVATVTATGWLLVSFAMAGAVVMICQPFPVN